MGGFSNSMTNHTILESKLTESTRIELRQKRSSVAWISAAHDNDNDNDNDNDQNKDNYIDKEVLRQDSQRGQGEAIYSITMTWVYSDFFFLISTMCYSVLFSATLCYTCPTLHMLLCAICYYVLHT